jgi:hypothetical protein
MTISRAVSFSRKNMSSRNQEAFLQSVNGTYFTDRSGNVLTRVGQQWASQAKIGIVTAWNPFFKNASPTINRRNNLELKRLLTKTGKQFQLIHAWWPDGTAFEESFVITDLSHREAITLCKRFHQGGYFWANKGGKIRLCLVHA